jgi:hypothetical protein
MLTSAVLRIVGFCTRHPWPVIAIAAALMICSALYTATHFAITTDTDQLLPEDLPWRQHELAYREEFSHDQILAFVHADKMRAQAGFHANDARWQPLKHIFETQPPDLPTKRDRSIGAQSNEVKYLLADVDTDYRQ